jgi:hypothetical protein
VRQGCTRILIGKGRQITFSSGLEILSEWMHTEARYLVRWKNFLGGGSGLVSGLWCLLENGNSKKFCQYVLSKLNFDKLSWVFAICLRNFFGFLSEVFFQVQVWVFME